MCPGRFLLLIALLLKPSLAPAADSAALKRLYLTSRRTVLSDATKRGEGVKASKTAQHGTQLQQVILQKCSDWDIQGCRGQNETQVPSTATSAALAAEEELLPQLRQILAVAHQLLKAHSGCSTNGVAATAECPRPAPELLQGATSAFLSSILLQYPRGPTSPDDLAAWASTSLAFLEAHHRAQRQQRAAVAAATAALRPTSLDEATDGKEEEEDEEDEEEEDEEEDEEGQDEEGQDEEGQGRRRLAGATARSGSSGNSSSDGSRSLPSHTGVHLGGLPLVRRVLMAQLLMGWLEPMQRRLPDSSAAAAAVAQLVTKLYEVHLESVIQRAVIEYFHISKAGGTSWTAAARASRCRKYGGNAARVRAFDDDCRWLNGTLVEGLGVKLKRTRTAQVCSRYGIVERRSVMRDCLHRLQHAQRSGFQYISNEYTLHGGHSNMYDTHICPQFVNVISIREPLERLASNIKYMLIRMQKTLFRTGPPAALFSALFCNASASRWESFAPPVVDNYNIRTLVGERAFHTELYGIGEAHEALAKALLLQFDLVLDLNSGPSVADLVMRSGLGWNATLAEVRVWTSEKLAVRGGVDLEECRVGDLLPLMSRQVYDQRWYSFGRTISRLDQLFLSMTRQLGLQPWPADWKGRGMEPPSEGADLPSRCGLLGLGLLPDSPT